MAALLLAVSAGAAACRGSPATTSGAGGAGAGGGAGGGDGGGDDVGVVCYGGGRCPCGITDISGATPSGLFAATKVGVAIEGTVCQFGSLDLGVSDDAGLTALTFTIPLGADAGPDSILGAHAVSIAFRTPTSPAVTTSGVVTVTAADDPRAAYASYFGDGGGAWSGMVAGSLTMSQDGFSVSGTFEGWYCGTDLPCARP